MKTQVNLMKMKKCILSLAVLLLMALSANAQSYLEAKKRVKRVYYNYVQHEASVYLMGGISNLMYSPLRGDKSMGFGGGFGGAYTYAFTEEWYLSGGLEFAIFNGTGKLGSFVDSVGYTYIDPTNRPAGEAYYLRSVYQDYAEKQTAYYVRLPIMAMYNYFYDKTTCFIALAGLKPGLSVYGKYTASADELNTYGSFPYSGHYGLTNADNGWQKNPGNASENPNSLLQDETAKLKFRFDLTFHLEGGARWQLTDNMFLYATAYFGIGMLNIKPKSKGTPLNVSAVGPSLESPKVDFGSNSMLTSTFAGGNAYDNGQAYVKGVHTIEFGLKFRMAFALGTTRPMFFRKSKL